MKSIVNILERKYNKYKLLLYHHIYPKLCSILDKRVDAKYLVIESDDWGSIRMPSKDTYNYLRKQGFDFDSYPFEKYDSLERDIDVEDLASVLLNYKDSFGNHPQITLDTVVRNPNFEDIIQNGYTSYVPESIVDTYIRYGQSSNVISLIKSGLNEGIFDVQYHSSEHFNVQCWLERLRENDEDTMLAFTLQMCGVPSRKNISRENSLVYGLKYKSFEECNFMIKALEEGIDLFNNIYGAHPTAFVAPCYWWDNKIESVLAKKGINIIQTTREWGNVPQSQIMYHYSGEHNEFGQLYSIRNCMFEPSTLLDGKHSCVDHCMQEIDTAFENKKIAVISSHRINYMGRISENNKFESLKMLNELIGKVLCKYPDVQFVSTSKLFNILK